MNLLLEEKVCTNCLLPRPLPSFVGDGHAFVLLDICSYCRDTMSGREQKISFNKLKHPRKDGEEAGFPHFKSKKRDRLSFYLANDKCSVRGHTLHVPKLGDVNMTEELRFAGKIMSATIFYRAGWWFASIAVVASSERKCARREREALAQG